MRMSTTVFADIISRHLDAFKFVTADERALVHRAFELVHRAFELAPSEPLPAEAFAAYLGTAAAAAWRRSAISRSANRTVADTRSLSTSSRAVRAHRRNESCSSCSAVPPTSWKASDHG